MHANNNTSISTNISISTRINILINILTSTLILTPETITPRTSLHLKDQTQDLDKCPNLKIEINKMPLNKTEIQTTQAIRLIYSVDWWLPTQALISLISSDKIALSILMNNSNTMPSNHNNVHSRRIIDPLNQTIVLPDNLNLNLR